MTEATIPPVRDCGRYAPGHSVHWIQARLTWSQPVPPTPLEVLGIDGGYIVVAADHGIRRFQNHDPPRIRALVDAHGPRGVLVGYHVLRLGAAHLVCVKEDIEGPLGTCVASSCPPR